MLLNYKTLDKWFYFNCKVISPFIIIIVSTSYNDYSFQLSQDFNKFIFGISKIWFQIPI